MSVIRSGKVRESERQRERERVKWENTEKDGGRDNRNKNQTRACQMLIYVMAIFPQFPYFCNESLSRRAICHVSSFHLPLVCIP